METLTAKHKPYSIYKPSGADWLGCLPAHWDKVRLKNHVANITDQADECGVDEIYLALENVESWTGRLRNVGKSVSFDSQVKRFQIGDVLFGKLRPYLAKVTSPNSNGVCVSEFLVLRGRSDGLMPKYLEYLLLSRPVIDAINSATFGAKMPRADWQFMGDMIQPFPPPAEQRAIAAFLDRETGKIDALVSKKERLIELLQEKRTALISHTVTRGLDPNAPMKDSRVEWLGDVPEHWEVAAAKRHFSIQLGKMLQNSPESPADAEVSYLKAQHVQWFQVLTEDIPTMWASQYEKSKFGIEEGDLLVCEGGEGGRCAILRRQIDSCIIQNALHRVRPRGQSLNAFLQYVMSAVNAAGWFDVLNEKATIAHFTKEKFDALTIPSPPPAEQRAIADFLDRETAKLDTLVKKVRRAIELLKELRATLISAAVTGKFDVREEKECT